MHQCVGQHSCDRVICLGQPGAGHSFSLPPAIRARIWREYRSQPQSPSHMAAVGEAVAFLRGDVIEAPAP